MRRSLHSVFALVFLDLDYLLLDLVQAHQLVELVRDLVEDLQLVLEQAGLLQVADEVHRRRNDVLVVWLWRSFILDAWIGLELGNVFHYLFSAVSFHRLRMRSLLVASFVLVKELLAGDGFLLLFFKLVFDLSTGL